MMNSERSCVPLIKEDLRQLKEIALIEHEEFFKRNPLLKDAYCNALIGIFLCQGAASHYLNPKVGVKDFDIWHFYIKNQLTYFPYRSHKRIHNGYKNKPIDFLKRAVPKDIYNYYLNYPGQVIMEYLLKRNTDTKRLLLRKAVIGLFPSKIFGEVLWRGEQ